MPSVGKGQSPFDKAKPASIAGYRRECLARLIPFARRTHFYRKLLSGISTGSIIKDLERAPLTSKKELLRSMGGGRFPSNCWCPLDRLTFIGSTGGPGFEALDERPMTVPLRPVDLARRSLVAARAFQMAPGKALGPTALLHEVSSSVVNQAMARGLADLGCRPVALGRGSTARFVKEIFARLGVTDLVTYPTYAAFLGTLAKDAEIELRFRRLFLWGEVGGSIRPVRKRLSELFSAKVHDIYAMQELGVLAAECAAGKGLHGFEDQFVYEIVDPSTGQPLGDGKVGELVVTDIHRSAFPLIRYRTGDITSIVRTKCKCGRTSLRLERIRGKASDVLEGEPRAYPGDVMEMLEGNPHMTGVFRLVPGDGAFLETKEHRGMADYYLDRFGRPPGRIKLERVLPRFLHRTEFVVNERYARLLKEQIGRER